MIYMMFYAPPSSEFPRLFRDFARFEQ